MSKPTQNKPSQNTRNPHGLPTKTCPVCGRPFTWRKKWARDWEQVVYCSDGCRKNGPPAPNNGGAG